MASLYPEINLPTIIAPQTVSRKKYSPAPSFDFATGDFKLDSHGRMILDDGQDAFEKWCLKTCMVERGTRLAYSDKIGIEFETAAKKSSPEAVKSAIIRTLTEAILVHPAAEYVKNFNFELEGDNLRVTFDVKGRDLPETFTVSVIY